MQVLKHRQPLRVATSFRYYQQPTGYAAQKDWPRDKLTSRHPSRLVYSGAPKLPRWRQRRIYPWVFRIKKHTCKQILSTGLIYRARARDRFPRNKRLARHNFLGNCPFHSLCLCACQPDTAYTFPIRVLIPSMSRHRKEQLLCLVLGPFLDPIFVYTQPYYSWRCSNTYF